MNYIVLIITAIAVAIVALIKEICDVRARRRQKALEIGDEAWRLLVKQTHGKSHPSKLAGEK